MAPKRPLPRVASNPPADDLAALKDTLPPAIPKAPETYTTAELERRKTTVTFPPEFLHEVRRQHAADRRVKLNSVVLTALFEAGWRVPDRFLPIAYADITAQIKARWQSDPPSLDAGADGEAERSSIYPPEAIMKQIRQFQIDKPTVSLAGMVYHALRDQGWPIPDRLINADEIP